MTASGKVDLGLKFLQDVFGLKALHLGLFTEGVPRTPTPAYQKLLLYVDAKTHQVRRVLLLDAQGNRNRFDFVSPSVNQPAPKGEFDFKPPRGTQVIKP